MEKEDSIEKVRELIYRGADHLEVHRALKEMHISDQKMKEILIMIEPDFVKYQLADQERTKVLNQVLVGGFILMMGIGVAVYSRVTVGYVFRFGYLLILLGIWWTFRGYFRYRQPIENFVSNQEYVRKRRFRK